MFSSRQKSSTGVRRHLSCITTSLSYPSSHSSANFIMIILILYTSRRPGSFIWPILLRWWKIDKVTTPSYIFSLPHYVQWPYYLDNGTFYFFFKFKPDIQIRLCNNVISISKFICLPACFCQGVYLLNILFIFFLLISVVKNICSTMFRHYDSSTLNPQPNVSRIF